jgi:hypothetical protein
MLPRWNPKLNSEITIGMPVGLQRGAAWLSVWSMGGLILVQIAQDLKTLSTTSLGERLAQRSLTSLELALVWAGVGAALYAMAQWRKGMS